MSVNITTKQILGWVGGIVASILAISIKFSIDSFTKRNEELHSKVDKIYDYATNHEVRMVMIENQLSEHDKKILDLQLAQQRMEHLDIQHLSKTNQTNLQPK